MKKICLLAALLLALSAPAAQAAQGGSVTGTTHTKGTERAMQIRSDEMLSTGTVSWDVAAPKNKKPQQRAQPGCSVNAPGHGPPCGPRIAAGTSERARPPRRPASFESQG